MMAQQWTTRALTAGLTLMFMTQPGFALAAHRASPRVRAAAAIRAHAAAEAPKQRLEAIMTRGEEVGAGVRLQHEERFAALARQIDLEGDADTARLCERLGAQLDIATASIASEHQTLGGSWGDLVIAHLLRANARFAITPAQVFALHQDGMAWTMVAHGMDLDVESFANAVESESHMVLGEEVPDTKLPSIGPAGSSSVSAE